ncbi:MAG: transcriptional regulator [Clostridia bacterium]|nr:transcriptional regulator [Clostridia bacterium]
MIDFIKLVENILEEQGKTKQSLFEDCVVSANTFFKYRQRYPSLKTVIKIANYLNVSLDYLFEFSNENHFKAYKYENLKFYDNLISSIESRKISSRQFCKDLGYAKDNIIRWKNGTQPSIQRLLEMTEYFGCSIDDLIL